MLANTEPPQGNHARAAPGSPLDGPARAPATICSCRLDTETGPAGPVRVLRVAGEIDLLAYPTVATAVTAILDQPPHDVVLDLAGVGFCCVRGFAVIVEAARTARAASIGFALCGLNPHLDRIFTMLWPAEPIVRYRSTAAAVTTIRIQHTRRRP